MPIIRTIFLTCLLCLAGDFCLAISKTDSLKAELERANSVYTRIELLNKLSYEYLRRGSSSEAIECAGKALELAEKEGSQEEIANSLIRLGNCHAVVGGFKEAIQFHLRSLETYRKAGNEAGMSKAYNVLGNDHIAISKYPEAIQFHHKGLEINRRRNDLAAIGRSYNNIGSIHNDLGDYSTALEYFFKSQKIKEEAGDLKGLRSTYANIGNVYFYKGDVREALGYYLKSYNLETSVGKQAILANNIGVAYKNLNLVDSSFYFYSLAMEWSYAQNDAFRKSQVHNNLAGLFDHMFEMEAKDSEKAWSYLDSAYFHYSIALGLNRSAGIDKETTSSLLGLGNVYVSQGKWPDAIRSFDEGVSIATRLDIKKEQFELYETLSDTWFALGECKSGKSEAKACKTSHLIDERPDLCYRNAIRYYKKFTELKELVFNEQKEQRIAILNVSYETEKKNNEISLLNKQKEVDELKIRKQTVFLWLISSVSLLILVSMLLLYRQSRLKNNLQSEENLRLNQVLEHNRWKLSASALHLVEKNELLNKLRAELDAATISDSNNIEHIKRSINQSIDMDEDWESFFQHFDAVHPQFFKAIKKRHPNLTPNNHKLCAYVRMNLSNKEIANLMNIAPESVGKSKKRLKKRLGLTTEVKLKEYIHSI